MSAIAEGNVKRSRKSRLPAGSVGVHRVMSELVRHGFDAQVAVHSTRKYDVIVRLNDLPPKPIQVRTVHVSPWYVRSSTIVGVTEDQITVYVLLGAGHYNSYRFFIARNIDLAREFRQPPNCRRS